jgi:hypothetical protein
MMRRLSLFSLLIAAAFAGCVDSDQGLSILGNYADIASGCATPTASSVSGISPITQGIYDIGIANGILPYTMNLVVINNFPSRTGAGGTTIGNVELVGFQVDLVPDPSTKLAAFLPAGQVGLTENTTQIFGGVVAPGANAIAKINGIEAAVGNLLLSKKNLVPQGPQSTYPTINLQITALGTYSGASISSNQISYPVQICNLCLAQAVGEPGVTAINSSGTIASCPAGGATSTQVVSTCSPQQDTPSTCCESSMMLLCGSQIPIATTGA